MLKLKSVAGILLLSCTFLFCTSPIASQNKKDDYIRDSIPQQWIANELFDQTIPIKDDWWKNFNDYTLDSLIYKAVVNNYDLLMAINRMDIAKASMRIQQGSFYPQFDVGVGWTPMRSSLGSSSLGSIPGYDPYTSVGSASINMSWEIDVIGSIRGRAKAEKEKFFASKEEYNAMMVSICSEVVSNYINLRSNQRLLKVANENLKLQEGTLNITEARYKSGLVSQLDVAQAKTVYESTKATIPSLQSNVLQYINAIGVLVGEYPWRLREQLLKADTIRMKIQKIAISVPADIIRQRPDIRAAESNILSTAAYLGATKADWWPKFYVNGSFGFASDNFKKFFSTDNMAWQIAPSMKWTIFSGRELNQTTKLYKAQLDEDINSYNKIILLALQEVDNAINMYQNALDQIQAQKEAVKQAELTLDLSLDLYKKGLIDFQNVLDAQRYLLTYENNLVSAGSNALLALVQLYKSLGGGWNNDNNKVENNQE